MKIAKLLMVCLLLLAGKSHADEKNFTAIKTHVEFLGYQCDQTAERLLCKTDGNDLNFGVFKRGQGLLLVATFKLKDEAGKNRAELMRLLNDMNHNALACRYYADNDTVFIEAFHANNYQKETFATLLSQFQSDWRQNLNKFRDRIIRFMG